MSNGTASRCEAAVFVAVVAAGVGLAAARLDDPLRGDEAVTAAGYAFESFGFAATKIDRLNNHVFHTLLVWVADRAAGPSIAALRIPAFLAWCLLLPAVWWFVRGESGWLVAAFATTFVATSRFLLEARRRRQGLHDRPAALRAGAAGRAGAAARARQPPALGSLGRRALAGLLHRAPDGVSRGDRGGMDAVDAMAGARDRRPGVVCGQNGRLVGGRPRRRAGALLAGHGVRRSRRFLRPPLLRRTRSRPKRAPSSTCRGTSGSSGTWPRRTGRRRSLSPWC